MKILLIRPNPNANKKDKLKKKNYIVKPLDLSILKEITPKKHQVRIIDEQFEDINYNAKYDLVGITVSTNTAPHSYQIADRFRKNGVKVVLGGWHPSVLPEEAIKHADAVIIGEAEILWTLLIEDLEKNQLKNYYQNTKPVSANLIPIINHNGFEDNKKIGRIQATRGCKSHCNFCSISSLKYRDCFRKRPVEKVIEELKKTPQKLLYFYDESMTLDPDYSKELFKKMKNLNKRIICNGGADVLSSDDELILFSKKAGCINWVIGFESINQNTIDYIGKTTNDVKDYKSAIKNIHQYKISVHGNFIFGLDTDKKNVFDNTLEEILNWELDSADFYIVLPFPGTRLFENLKKEKRITTFDWSKYVLGNIVFQPKLMTTEELNLGIQKMYQSFYSKQRILKRFFKNLPRGYYSTYVTMLGNLSTRK